MANRARLALEGVLASMKQGVKVEWKKNSYLVPPDGGIGLAERAELLVSAGELHGSPARRAPSRASLRSL